MMISGKHSDENLNAVLRAWPDHRHNIAGSIDSYITRKAMRTIAGIRN